MSEPQNSTDPRLSELLTAKIAAQRAFKPLAKSGYNTHFKQHYSTLADMHEACGEGLGANGLNVTQVVEGLDGKNYLVTYLYHTNGAFLRSDIPLEARADPQSVGSWLTYLRRYGLAAMLGLESEMDDDGEAAMQRGKEQVEPTKAVATPAEKKPEPAKKGGLNYAALVEDLFVAIGCHSDDDKQAVLTFCVNDKCTLDNWKKGPKKVHDAIQAKCATVKIDDLLMRAKLEAESKQVF